MYWCGFYTVQFLNQSQGADILTYSSPFCCVAAHWILLKYLDGEPYEGICNNSTRQAAIMFVCNHDISTVS